MISDLSFLTGFNNIKGWFPVKLFEYAKNQIPIILYPSDNNVIEGFLKKTKTGFSFNNKLYMEQKSKP